MQLYVRECEKYRFQDDDYEIIIPETLDAILEESAHQHHCLYQSAFDIIDGYMKVVFMRKKKKRYKSLVTIEIANDSISQAKACCNEVPTLDQMRFIAKFAKAKGLAYCELERRLSLNIPDLDEFGMLFT